MNLVDLNVPPGLSAREQRIAALATSLAREFAAAAAEHDKAGTFPLLHYQRLHESGYLRLALPRDHGGDGANLFEMVLAQERLAQGDAATAVGVGMLLNVIGRMGEESAWPEPVFAQVCQTIAREGGLVNSVVTEPDLGSISRGGVPATTATRVPGGWAISGHKIFVTAAPALRFLLTAVHLPPSDAAPQGEVARAIVEAPAAGLRFTSTWQDALSQRSGASDDAFFERVFVPDDRIVEHAAVGVPGPPPGANGWWLTLVAVYLGIAQASLDAASDYANERVPSVLGQPLAGLPHIQQWIGQMQLGVITARALLHDTARRWTDRPQDRPQLGAQIAATKHLVTNTACSVTELGLRVAGGFSLTRRLTLERHFRDARGGLFQPPQDDLALGLLGRTALAARRGSTDIQKDIP
jgi:alkylation response protein AidB-like acyl-CoA dehydrogenase